LFEGGLDGERFYVSSEESLILGAMTWKLLLLAALPVNTVIEKSWLQSV
jgi:hypothetical protein